MKFGHYRPGCGPFQRSGYSLTEMLIVIILIGIVGTMAIPNMTSTMSKAKADRAATVVRTDIQAAFSLASRQRKPVQIAVNTTNQSYEMRDRTTSTVLFSRRLGGGESPYGVTGLSVSTSPVYVFPNGLASSAFTIRLNIGEAQRRVVVTRAGLIRIST